MGLGLEIKRSRIAWALAFGLLVLIAPHSAQAGEARPDSPAALVAALQRAGLVVVLRHAITDRTQADRGDLADRNGQRNLSASGQAQAAAIGRALATLQIPVGAALTSPVFRARDTADLVFGPGRAQVAAELTADDYEPDAGRMMANVAWLRSRTATAPAAGNDVLVGHIVPLSMALGRSLSNATYPEGAMAVFRPSGILHGILTADDLIAAAEAARR